MQIYLSIDDTDNLESPGSGQLAEDLSEELCRHGLARQCSNITRHQLFFHEDIPYTSHNSSMCFSAFTDDDKLEDVIQFSSQFLITSSAPGSDPGLCVAINDEYLSRDTLVDFGQRAKNTILTKDDAYQLAENSGVHLSEHGGTGDGVVGALAGIGLRIGGNDGRFRGWLNLGSSGDVITVKDMCSHSQVEGVVDYEGNSLSADTKVRLTEDKIKTVMIDSHQVISVRGVDSDDDANWATLSKKQVKTF